jgi:hypothetical protein
VNSIIHKVFINVKAPHTHLIGGIDLKKHTFLPKLLLLLMLITCAAVPVQAVFSAVTNADQVKMFADPDPSSPIEEVLKIGDVVKVNSKSDDGQFWQVEHKGHHGWIKVYQLSPKDHRY